MSASKGLIDFGALEKELRGSLQFEEKYYRENAAKLRAVNQKVGSYDEFRNERCAGLIYSLTVQYGQ
ncbi:hypothetical protein NQD34_001550 [Periophthalmus magnuspinnatus]|nr:hypothetical protein NQD34_001550 [Periophthalmus magnuspinnatus]